MKPCIVFLAATALMWPAVSRSESFSQTYAIGLDIPDSNSLGRLDIQGVSLTDVYINGISITLEIDPSPGQSAFLGDLYAYLEHDGVTSVLLNRPGRRIDELAGFDDNQPLNVTFADGAPDVHSYRVSVSTPLAGALTGTFSPDGRATDPGSVLATDARTLPLSGFLGLNGTGDWRLFVADLSGGGEHRLTSWRLDLQTTAVPEPAVWCAAAGLAGWALWRRSTTVPRQPSRRASPRSE